METLANPSWRLSPELAGRVGETLTAWDLAGNTARLWNRDATLWTGADEGRWLGWLDVVAEQSARLPELQRFASEVKSGGFSHALLLGMGGSSLCPEVLETIFSSAPGHPRLHVLDSTDPARVAALEAAVDLRRTLFIVSSKSGSTLEPNIFLQYFLSRARAVLGESAARRFIAITDPGSRLERVAQEAGFLRIFPGVPSIGGRYSALSDFGLIPAAVLGLDLERFLDSAERMVKACRPGPPAAENPGVRLGVLLGEAARAGRDKVTIFTSPPLWDAGAWLEQLLAESTGKRGKGLIPVDGEPIGPPEDYGSDRLFVHLRLAGLSNAGQEKALAALEEAGQPVVHLAIADAYDLGGEFFRWEIATAVAGSLLGINPFDQPDVEASKDETRKLTTEYEAHGELPAEAPLLEEDGLRLFADPRGAAELLADAGRKPTLASVLRAHLRRLKSGDYFALLAYVEMNDEHRRKLQEMRLRVRDAKRVATCLGFGPRFLHSTGQAYKGGPNSGVFLQITCDDARDLPVPGQKYTFGVVKAAQARGDFAVLAERGRRALRVHLGADVAAGLAMLRELIEAGLKERDHK